MALIYQNVSGSVTWTDDPTGTPTVYNTVPSEEPGPTGPGRDFGAGDIIRFNSAGTVSADVSFSENNGSVSATANVGEGNNAYIVQDAFGWGA